ncbi:HAD-IC family P-type ATPase [Candidatus Saccharibacteria bacterium]|nr:HAD-IC family P-type ATPase [Candidatus Saccharibacteria bacterium]
MISGLRSSEVEIRRQNGQSNSVTKNVTKISDILKKHTLTVFNFVNLTLAALIFFFGNKRDTMFVFIAVIATAIAIINDLRSRRKINRLHILSERPISVVRDGKICEINDSDLVLGDVIRYSLGDQITVDAVLLEGVLEVNESFITGESDNIQKLPGEKLHAGSFIVSGTGFARATAVGEASSLSKTLKNAQKIKDSRSELFTTLQKIIKLNSLILIPVAIFLFLKQSSLSGATLESAVTSTGAAVIAMIPEGLILLTSSVLALATIRLSRQKIIVSDFYSIETLARVDTICLDKTGTLTTGRMKVEKIIPFGQNSEAEIINFIKISNAALGDFNSTSHALIQKFGKNSEAKVDEFYPFSSQKKYSGIKFGDTEFFLGAYSYLTSDTSHAAEEAEYAKSYRVLTAKKCRNNREELLGFVLLSDELRKDAKSLLNFFQKNDVKVKIISGDSPTTVAQTVKTLGLKSTSLVDFSDQKSKTLPQSLVEEHDIFARVTPDQKQSLVKSLRASGHVVAMTGDGVNDVLALKAADCGISLGAGADAARRVADIVLLENDFSVIKSAVFEGRKTINNVTRSSALFLQKTIFATVLSVVFIFLNLRYPFSPVLMSLVNVIIIGIPSFVLAFEPNYARIKNNFKSHILKNSVPAALATIFAIISTAALSFFLNLAWSETLVFSYFLVSFIGLLLIYKISRPLNKFRLSLLVALSSVVALVFLLEPARNFLDLTLLPLEKTPLLLLCEAASFLIFFFSSRFLSRRLP